MSTSEDKIAKTIAFVKEKLADAEGGHDWFHIERVYKNAILISKSEHVDALVVAFGALLHDIADSKFHNGDETVVQDADRLDAIGAVGIARCFNYGGFKNRPLYNPDIKPNLNMSKEAYKSSIAPTINHFYEKLLLLKDKMNTKTGHKIALQRHEYMESFLKQFYREWNGK